MIADDARAVDTRKPSIAFSVRTVRTQFSKGLGDYFNPGETSCRPSLARVSPYATVDLISQVTKENSIVTLDLSASMLIKEWSHVRSLGKNITFEKFLEDYSKELRTQAATKATRLWNVSIDVDKPLLVSSQVADAERPESKLTTGDVDRLKKWVDAFSKLGTEHISVRIDPAADPESCYLALKTLQSDLGGDRLLIENGEISSMLDFEKFASLCATIREMGSKDQIAIGSLLNFGAVRFRFEHYGEAMLKSLCGCLVGIRIASDAYGTPDRFGEEADRKMFLNLVREMKDRPAVISIECSGPQIISTKKLYPGITSLKNDIEAEITNR